ncbi:MULTISPECIES: MarR family winged helix-turn-helix transcriptional regulator [unclassified Amycolatopsis]|uniref:MarR family winged helix-turn-helix transcriptional regulator n=1 Tax=unclassified Amycolatopsis TaxID=2618356 RepID=UPI0028749B78|nr:MULTISPECIES: MarR family winged helix-turn-helix transcriptional regulator [unclassified Amycolatopsis]MDS0136490.1 winged helix-turn-helix transcriptional regulator [Amycolatopsis sp. 505]MDS0146005.1 winged helix-turn-helix transcriptional regulator [Amycolatopsis sp. CM201R]
MHTSSEGGPALFRLVRHWARQWAPDVVDRFAAGTPPSWTVPNLFVIQAIDGTAGDEVTVADVARQLGIDRSVASRMVSEAARAGFVERSTSTRDARRAVLTLTEFAKEFLEASQAHQRQAFDALVGHWPQEDRERFAGYLGRLADEVLG